MKMKHALPVIMGALLLTGCNGGGGNNNGNLKNATIEEAEGLTYEELLAKAREEVGDNTIQVFGNSSQLQKALTKFQEETGIKVNNTKLGDADLYNQLGTAFQANKYVADMVLLQDGNCLLYTSDAADEL